MVKEEEKRILMEVVKRHFDNDEDLAISTRMFVVTIASLMKDKCFALDEGIAREMVSSFLLDEFVDAVINSKNKPDSFLNELFCCLIDLLDFNTLARFYLEEALANTK